jgi:hypothetical protein
MTRIFSSALRSVKLAASNRSFGFFLVVSLAIATPIVKFQDMVYTLLSGHSLHLWDLRPALHSSGALGAEVDFAEQGVAEEDQYAMVDALECDGM